MEKLFQINVSAFIPYFLLLLVTTGDSIELQYGSTSNHTTCSVTSDPLYGGDDVDCSSRGILVIDNSWFSENTTKISLDYNPIQSVRNNSFPKLFQLRYLSIEFCKLTSLEVGAFSDLRHLEVLMLRGNELKIKDHAFPFGLFDNSQQLKKLFIGNNKNYGFSKDYSKYIDIFMTLPQLEDLHIDSFQEVYFGDEFATLRSLKNISIYNQDSLEFSNNTFEGLQHVRLLELIRGKPMKPLGLSAFQNLNSLDILEVRGLREGNSNIALSMFPFVGKNLTVLIFDQTSPWIFNRPAKERVTDTIIRQESTQYLTKICIQHFSWRNSDILGIEHGTFFSNVWQRCLKSIDLTGNNILFVDRIALFQATALHNLEVFNVGWSDDHDLSSRAGTRRRRSVDESQLRIAENSNTKKLQEIHKPPLSLLLNGNNSKTELDRPLMQELPCENRNCEDFDIYSSAKHQIQHRNIPSKEAKSQKGGKPFFSFKNKTEADLSSTDSKHRIRKSNTHFVLKHLFKSLRILRYHHLTGNLNLSGNTIYLKKLEELYYTNNGPIHSTTANLIINPLRILDLTNTPMIVSDNFLHLLPNLETIILSRSLPDPDFMKTSSRNFFYKTLFLKHLNLSGNDIWFLENRTFETNTQLVHLGLSSNKFSTVPFNLSFTPSLNVLDLRQNAFSSLTNQDRISLDNHAMHLKNFTLLLDGNPFVCSCPHIGFLGWLHTTNVALDKEGNYDCVTADGTFTTTKSMGSIEGVRRQCNGRYFFMLTLILASIMVIGFLGVFLGNKFKTQVISFVLQTFAPDFRLKTRNDYKLDVFIGYADDDFRFVRNVLRKYLEEDLNLKTFIHQRDLLQDNMVMTDAMHDSWRIILYITNSFLNRYDLAHYIMKNATYFIEPTNPAKVMVIVEESQSYKIPEYVLKCLDEARITVVNEPSSLNYEQRQRLKQGILY